MGTIVTEIDARLGAAGAAADGSGDPVAHGADGAAAPADVVRSWGPEQWGPILERAVRAAAITVSRPGANPPYASELG